MRKYKELADKYLKQRGLRVDFICNLNNGERLNKTCYVLANKAVQWLKKDESDED